MYPGQITRKYLRNKPDYRGLLLLFSGILFCGTSYPQTHVHQTSPVLDQTRALELSQSVIGKTTSDHRMSNQDGKPVSLSAYRGKPLVINFIYTSCYHTCPVMTVHLNNVVNVAREALGRNSFQVLTVGFDTGVDTPERMRLFATERGIKFDGWEFLSGDAVNVRAITSELGFSFAPSPKGFDHLAQTTVLDATGRVYRQVYGADFETQALVEPLKELVFGKPAARNGIDGWINGIRLFCTIYDPTTGRYRFDYSIFIMIAVGVLCLGSILVFIIRSWREKT
jgi:protein SCO1/2